MEKIFFIVFVLIFVLAFGLIIRGFIVVFSPKAQSKELGKLLKTQKRMLEDNKDVIEELGGMSINMRKNLMENYEDELKDISNMNANIHKDSVRTMASAVKDGFAGSEGGMFCSYCGSRNSSDSVFCKKCGKKQ